MGTLAIGKKYLCRKALQSRIKFSDLVDCKIPTLAQRPTPQRSCLRFLLVAVASYYLVKGGQTTGM
jgi:hypothetical protein